MIWESIVEELGWHEGVLAEGDSWQWSEGRYMCFRQVYFTNATECCSRHREIVFSAMPASDMVTSASPY